MEKGALVLAARSSAVLVSRPLVGFAAMLGNTILIPTMAVAIKYLTVAGFTTIQMLGWRSALVMAVLLPFLLKRQIRQEIMSADLKAHLFHATLSIASMSCFYFALRTLPIVTVTSINFTTPTIAMLLASLLYKEAISIKGWLALIAGFLGALLVLKPDLNGISSDMLVVLAGSFLAACTNLAVRRMPARSSNFAVIFYLTCSGVVFFSLPGMLDFRVPLGNEWFWILMLGFVALAVHVLIILSYRLASSMLIGVLDYLRIIWALAFGYFFFSEEMSLIDGIGVAMICISGFYTFSQGRPVAQIINKPL
jgi:drug/metabolite transporter (DMT)-like permease